MKVFVNVYENIGYKYLEKTLIRVFDNLQAANQDYNNEKINPKTKFLIMKSTNIRRN